MGMSSAMTLRHHSELLERSCLLVFDEVSYALYRHPELGFDPKKQA
jgi:hypothetical protein